MREEKFGKKIEKQAARTRAAHGTKGRLARRTAGLAVVVLVAGSLLSACSGGPRTAEMQEYKEQGIAQMDEGDYAGAAESFQDAIDESVGLLGSEELDITYYKALALYLSGDAEAALETYDALIDYDPDNWENYYLRGNVYLQEGEIDAAQEDYDKAVSLSGENEELSRHISDNLSDLERLEREQELAALWEEALSTEDYEQAIEYLTEAREIAEGDMLRVVVTDLVAAYEYTEDFQSAYEVAGEYLKEHEDAALEREYEFLSSRVDEPAAPLASGTAETEEENASAAAD